MSPHAEVERILGLLKLSDHGAIQLASEDWERLEVLLRERGAKYDAQLGVLYE